MTHDSVAGSNVTSAAGFLRRDVPNSWLKKEDCSANRIRRNQTSDVFTNRNKVSYPNFSKKLSKFMNIGYASKHRGLRSAAVGNDWTAFGFENDQLNFLGVSAVTCTKATQQSSIIYAYCLEIFQTGHN